MKRIIIIFLILLIPAAGNCSGLISNIASVENNIFGYEYSNESDSKRIERIENYLYGSKKSGNLSKRMEAIQNDMGYTASQSENIQSVDNTAVNQETSKNQNNSLALKEDDTVEYPMVDKMEEELFHTTYKQENIYSRLNRLEQKVFNKTTNEALNDRVNNLASVVNPRKSLRKHRESDFSSDELDNYYRNSGLEPVNNQSMPFQLAVIEQDLLNNEFQADNVAVRLNRLENKLFNRTFATDNDVTRLQRIMVAYDAKKNSYKYENNRRMQNMAAISQFGGILLMILAMIL